MPAVRSTATATPGSTPCATDSASSAVPRITTKQPTVPQSTPTSIAATAPLRMNSGSNGSSSSDSI